MDPREAFAFADDVLKAARVAKDAMLAVITAQEGYTVYE